MPASRIEEIFALPVLNPRRPLRRIEFFQYLRTHYAARIALAKGNTRSLTIILFHPDNRMKWVTGKKAIPAGGPYLTAAAEVSRLEPRLLHPILDSLKLTVITSEGREMIRQVETIRTLHTAMRSANLSLLTYTLYHEERKWKALGREAGVWINVGVQGPENAKWVNRRIL
jgi:hypothetical protein